MTLDILLINPPTSGSYAFLEKARDTRSPLGLASIAAYLLDRGRSVQILDLDVEPLMPQELFDRIKKLSPRVVGFACTTPTVVTSIRLAQEIKNFAPDVYLVAGGPHATALPLETLRQSVFDIVVRGEGEETIAEILVSIDGKKPFSEIPGISYKHDGRILENKDRALIKDIDSLPFPARHLLPMSQYQTNNYLEAYGSGFANIMATRGCPYQCTFCGQDITFKHEVRRRSAARIVDEIEDIQKEFRISVFLFEDSTFTAYPELVRQTCKEILKRKLRIRWGAMGRVNLADLALYKLMKQAGCRLIFYGVESGDEIILKKIKKNISLKQVKSAVRIAHQAGIPVNTSFIVGLPGDSEESIKKTISFAISLNADYATFSLATPYPGTEFYRQALEEGSSLLDWKLFGSARYSEPLYVPAGLTKETLKKYYSASYKMFYFRPAYLLRQIFKIRSLRDFLHKWAVALGLLKGK